MNKLLIALATGCFMGCFGGCASTSATTPPKPQITVPPDTLLMDCHKTPKAGIATNADLALGFRLRGDDIDNCNADKAALRTWKASVLHPEGANGPQPN